MALPKLVKQRYGTELRARTQASIKPEISQALDSLLDEITSADDAKIIRTATAHYQQNKFGQIQSFSRRQPSPFSAPRRSTSTKACPLCKQAGRSNLQHFLSECPYIPEQDRRYMAKVRQVTDVHEEDDDYEYSHELHQPEIVDQSTLGLATAQRIDIRQSPYLDTFCGHHTVRVTIDSGATGNMIRHSTALRLGCEIKSSSQSAHQADEFVEVNLPTDLFTTDSTFALEPRLDTTGNKFTRDSDLWPQPSLVTSVDGVVRIPHLTNTTRLLKRNEHFCQIRDVFVPDVPTNTPLRFDVISKAIDLQPRRSISHLDNDLSDVNALRV